MMFALLFLGCLRPEAPAPAAALPPASAPPVAVPGPEPAPLVVATPLAEPAPCGSCQQLSEHAAEQLGLYATSAQARREGGQLILELTYNVGEGIAECRYVFQAQGLMSRRCEGQYVTHSMGDGDIRSVFELSQSYSGGQCTELSGQVLTSLASGQGPAPTAARFSLERPGEGVEFFGPEPEFSPEQLAFLGR